MTVGMVESQTNSLSEKDQKLGELLARIRDSFQASVEAIDEFLNFLGKPYEARDEKPYEKLFWETREGTKGPFEMTTQKANQNSDLFRHLQAILKQSSGRLTEKGWVHYYWLGTEGDVIFRRKKKGKQ